MGEDKMRPPANDARYIALLSGDASFEIGQLPDAMTHNRAEMPFVLFCNNRIHRNRQNSEELEEKLVLISPAVSTVKVSLFVKECLEEHNLRYACKERRLLLREIGGSREPKGGWTKMEQRLQIIMGMGPSPSLRLVSPLPILPHCTGRPHR